MDTAEWKCALPRIFNVPRFSENKDDIALAEKWLREQAQAQGWAKAQKLQV
jgi:hypothetical protein